MLTSIDQLRQTYQNYKNVDDKISRMTKAEDLFRLTRGWYETDGNAEGVQFISVIWQPSYLSFEAALSWYQMIPERVAWFTCATMNSHKTRKYTNHFGQYIYMDVPGSVFYMDLQYVMEYPVPFLLASREKALCDTVYKKKALKNTVDMENLLFKDLRIDPDEFTKLRPAAIHVLAEHYHSRNVSLLEKVVYQWTQ